MFNLTILNQTKLEISKQDAKDKPSAKWLICFCHFQLLYSCYEN